MLRVEDRRLLAGSGKFLDDFKIAGMYYASIVRSPYAHARIESIDVSKALDHPGVLGVLTGKEVGEMSDPFPVGITNPPQQYAAAIDKARYVGEPVAVVVAKDPYTAEDAAELVEVLYVPLASVVDIKDAISGSAPILHDELNSNIAMHRHLKYGEPEKALDEAEVIVEDEYYFPRYTSCPLETFAVLSSYDKATGVVTVQSNFQGPWTMFGLVVKALRLSSDKLRFEIPRDNGGGFGIKSSMFPHIALISLASMKFGVPIKWIESRKEHLLAASSHVDRLAVIKVGAKKDGTLTVMSARFMDNMGAYVRAPEPGSIFRSIGNIVGPYRVRNVELDAYAVVTNKCPTGPNRGYGCQHLYFCWERIMDKLANKLGLSAAEIRLKNFIKSDEFPYLTPTGGLYDSGDYSRVLIRALELGNYLEWKKKQQTLKKEGRLIGIGIAVAVDPSVSNMGYVTLAFDPNLRNRKDYLPKSGGAHTASVKVEPSGKVVVKIDSNPQGQGHETVITQIVSDELGIKPEDVYVDTNFSVVENMWTVSSGTYSSRFASVGTSAVAVASRRVQEKVLKIAAKSLGVKYNELDASGGYVYVRSSPEKKISFRHIAGIAHWNPDSLPPDVEPGLFGYCQFNLATLKPPDDHDRVNSSGTYGFAADVAVVEIDQATGKMKILDYATVHDVGTVINPLILEGQVHGAFLHGLAGALYEELLYDKDGQLQASTFIDYLCPTAMEHYAPRIDHVVSPSPFTTLGSKGAGESSTETVPAAIANALSDAIYGSGREVTRLPLTPEEVWKLCSGV